MASSAEYLAAVLASIELTIAPKTLISLTNQRKNEVGTSEPPAAVVAIDYDVLNEAIRLAAAAIEDELGAGSATTVMHIKLAAELTIAELATAHAVNISDLGLAGKDDIMKRVGKARKLAVSRKPRIENGRRATGWKPGPSGHNPFDEMV